MIVCLLPASVDIQLVTPLALAAARICPGPLAPARSRRRPPALAPARDFSENEIFSRVLNDFLRFLDLSEKSRLKTR